jgi:phosphoribosylformylglycinamidine synthase
MVQVGLLPGPGGGDGGWSSAKQPEQTVSLAHNAGGRFIDRWVGIAANPDSPCIWTRPLADLARSGGEATQETLILPIAHGEGRLVAASDRVLDSLRDRGQIALTYLEGDNPNGSTADIAGLCDPTGRIFGLMPHPERYLDWMLHPFWTRLSPAARRGEAPGLLMFRAAVEAAHPPAAARV